MRKPRCSNCKFWIEDKSRNDDGRHKDDYLGLCRRNAPRPRMGDFEYRVLEALWHLLLNNNTPQDMQEFHNNWEEAGDAQSYWPSTTASDWCGEFKARR